MRATRIGMATGLGLLISVSTTACGNVNPTGTGSQAQAAGGSQTSSSESDASEAGAADDSAAGTPVALGKVETAFSMFSFDYEPVASPQELEGPAQLVVSGSVTEVVAGRSETRSGVDRPPVQNAAVGVKVESVLKGSADVGDVVWFEVPTDPSILKPGLPEGARLALYLTPAASSDSLTSYSTSSSSVPDGADLWTFVHPQGLTLQYGAEAGTVEPAADLEAVDPDATVEDALPEN